MKRIVPLALLLLFFATETIVSQTSSKEKSVSVEKTMATNDNYRAFTINNVFNYYSNNGDGSYNRYTSNPGFEFPKGSLKTAVFEDGLLWGGFHKGRVDPKVGGSYYRHGLQAGRILSNGTATTDPVADDPLKPVYRVYCVRPDVSPRTTFESVRTLLEGEAALIVRFDSVTTAQNLYDQYIQDWNEWPARRATDPTGLAPFTDLNGNGMYEPETDIPGQPGADQTLYYVANDVNSCTYCLAGSPPIGLEFHRTIWGLNRTAALGQTIFSSSLIINKSGAPVDSMFLLQWVDADIGDGNDDFVGCDIGRDLGFAYNGRASDSMYGMTSPAAGYRLLQGPRVPSPGDSALFQQKFVKGYKNLSTTAFVFFSQGFAQYSDPASGTGGDIEWYRLMNGLTAHGGVPFIDPVTGQATKFCMSGDPVTRQGWIDGMAGLGPQDRRMCLSTGPFTMAVNDTQEIVVATLIGQGIDRLSSVAVLKWYSDMVQSVCDNLFNMPSPPPAPRVDVAALDGQIVLTWGNPADYVPLEASNSVGHVFEGYNVYQLPGPAFDKRSAKLLVTYDLIDAIGTVFDDQIDEATGYIVKKAVQFGTDSGIKRQYITTRDVLQDRNLINGTTYYFGVTAYSVNPDPAASPTSLESIPEILEIIPEKPRPGFTPAAIGDTIKTVTHTNNVGSPSDGEVIATIVNPMLLTGGGYRIAFQGPTEDQTWSLIRTLGTRTDTLANRMTDQTGSDSGSIVIDGIQWRVINVVSGFKRFLVVANANGALSPPDIGTFAFNENGFPTLDGAPPDGINDRPSSRQQVNGSKWGICTASSGSTDASYSRFLERTTRSKVAGVGGDWPWIAFNDYEIRFTAAGGKAEMAFTTGTMVDVPFELWNIGGNTPANPADDYRMIPWINEFNGNEKFDLDSVDSPVSGGDNDPETDWIYWMNPTDTMPGHAGYDAWAAETPQNDTHTGHEAMARMVLVNWNGGSVSDATFPNNMNAMMPETGTIFRILTSKPNQPGDVFTITVPAYQYDAQQAKVDVDKVNVFPNPYDPFKVQATGNRQFVTFTHLPYKAHIRVFTLAGILVRTMVKENPEQFYDWDLNNDHGNSVASGMYIVHIDMPELGKTKILKLGVGMKLQ